MRASRHYAWTVFFFGLAFLFALPALGFLRIPDGAFTAAKILLFGSVLLGFLALVNALHERRLG